jgi:hypothetical protein
MKLLKIILVVVAATGVMGSAQALAQTNVLSPTALQATNVYSTGITFAEIYNFTIGAQYQTLLSSAVSYQPAGATAGQDSVSNLTLALYDAGGVKVTSVSSSNGSLINLSGGPLVAGAYSLKVSGTADGSVGGGYQISIAAVPEPAGWMMLLSGLAVVTFMARRKAIPVTG